VPNAESGRGRGISMEHQGGANDQMIPAQWVGVVTARLESPLGVGNGLVKPSPGAHSPEGLYIARTLVGDRWDVSVRFLNAARRDQLTKGFLLALWKPRWWSHPMWNNHRSGTLSRSYWTWLTKPNLSDSEFGELEELLTKYEVIFARDGDNYRWTNGVYHTI
jgi:hypothetical protein